MKKLFLLIGLVVFVAPSLVNADESDLNNYHCIKSKTKNTNFDAYCFCIYPNGKIFPQRYDNMNLSDYQNLTFYGSFQFGISDNYMEVIDKVLNNEISEYKFKKIYNKVEEEYYQSIKKSQKILGKQIELDDDRKRFQFYEKNHRNFLTQMMMMESMSEFGKSEVK